MVRLADSNLLYINFPFGKFLKKLIKLIEQGVIYFSVKLTVSKDNEVLKNVVPALASSAK